jgi:serine/threonine protein kinase/WD40 repeat protein
MRYGVLGPVEAKLDDVPVAVGGPQQRRLLALLLSRPGESISSERLVDCLWPDGLAPDGAARSVMTYVSRLRTALGDASISTVQEGYQLELCDSVVDSQQFETLLSEAGTAEPGRATEIYDRALALWRGTAYGEFGAEWWLLSEANRLNEMRVVAMEERAEALLAVGHHHRVIPELERLVADHPLRERPVSLLMQAMFATGRHADALRAYQAFRTRLADETGLDPSSELVALERSMASGQPIPNLNARARLLRGYTVHDVLGEGASGRVFAATQPGTNREVAIKAIRPDLANVPEFIQRFEAEAQLVARLEHPHIVPLYDYWRDPGGAYLVFRLLLGGTAFAAMVNGGPFSVAGVSRLIEEVGGALLAAHMAGVVHCDIKPSNVLFDETGNAYLSDFGIAVTSAMPGQAGERTRAYAAPELVDRCGDTVRSDIFSFGCMLWELLAGRSPLSVIQPSNRWRLPSLAGTLSEPCEALDAVLARATSSDPEVRFESMAELIVAWRDAVGRPEGVLSPMFPSLSSSPDSPRRRAARALTATVSASVNPYKGLRAFTEGDASDFFGRDDVAALLHQTVMARGFVVVVGPSGSGKSSLVHAGLVPLLRHDGVPVATMVPGDRPSVALRQALRQVAATDSDSSDPIEWLKEAVAVGSGQLVLVVDQFEECWTLADEVERERFLGTVVAAGSYGVRCVTTVRADLYDRPLQHASIGQMVADGSFALSPLTPQALEEAVARPAEQHGVDFEEGVVTAIVAEANAHPAGLPLLQFAMAELYERRVDNVITSRCLTELGGLGGAIGRRAEEIYTSLDDDMRTQTRQLFGRLVAPGQGAPDTRRRARFSELSESDRAVADRFVVARLLVADRDLATREPVIEVAHESLLSNWPRLREWLDADRRWLAQLQHLATASRSWDEGGRPDGELYRGSRLEAVLEALPDHSQQLSSDEHEFVDASRTARDAGLERERHNARRLRRRLVATACLLVLALIAGGLALSQRQQARDSADAARLEALVGRSLSLRATQRDTAALLAIEVYRITDTPRTRSALFSTFTMNTGALSAHALPDSTGDKTRGIVLPDGTTAFVVLEDKHMHTYDLDTGQIGEPWSPLFDSHYYLQKLVSSADGRFVAEVAIADDSDGDFDIGVHDTQSRELVTRLHVPFQADNATFSPDGTRLYLAGGTDGDVIAFSIPDGTEIGHLDGFSRHPDSTWLWTTAGLAFVDGGLLAVGSTTGTVRLVDPTTFADVGSLEFPPGKSNLLTAFNGGRSLLGEGPTGRIRWDLGSPTPQWNIDETTFARNQLVESDPCAIADQFGRLYCADAAGRLEERDLSTGGLIRALDLQNGSAGSLWIARNGTELVSFASQTQIVTRWRIDGSGPVSRRLGNGYEPVSYSPDGSRLIARRATAAADQTDLAVLDAATGGNVDSLSGWVFAGWSSDRTLIGARVAPDGTLVLERFDLETNAISASVSFAEITCPDPYCGTIFESEHRLWVVPQTGRILTIDKVTMQQIEPTLVVSGINYVSGSGDGDRVVVSSDSGTIVFDGHSGDRLGAIEDDVYNGTSFVTRLAVAPGGRFVAATIEGDVLVYDLETRNLLHNLSGTRGSTEVAVNGDGMVALATGQDHSVTIYDVPSGEQIGDRMIIPESEAVAGAVRPDGMELAMGGGLGRDFLVWDLDPHHWATAACELAGHSLTPEEWDTYIGDLAEYHETCPSEG